MGGRENRGLLHDRHPTRTGIWGNPKKHGGGGRGTWGRVDEFSTESYTEILPSYDPSKDPNNDLEGRSETRRY